MEDDEALLAELRAISNRSAAGRFDGGDNDNNDDDNDDNADNDDNNDNDEVEAPKPKLTPARRKTRSNTNKSPGRQGKGLGLASPERAMEIFSDMKNIIKAEGKREAEDNEYQVFDSDDGDDDGNGNDDDNGNGNGNRGSIVSQVPNDDGGVDDDAALLAELRAVSSKTDRFADDDNDDDDDGGYGNSGNDHVENSSPPRSSSSNGGTSHEKKAFTPNRNAIPPWKRKKTPKKTPKKDSNNDDDEPESSSNNNNNDFGGFKKSPKPKTFVGDRGGEADDADLLAELRAISAGNKSADRFAGDDDDNDNEDEDDPFSKPEPIAAEKSDIPPWKRKKALGKKNGGDVPPWKKKGAAKKTATVDPFDNVEVMADEPKTSPAKSPSKAISEPVEDEPESSSGFGGFKKNSQPKTFVGDRGGEADDADLLAELRAISAGNKSADRFAGEDDDEDDDPLSPPKPVARKKADVPPWKKKKAPGKKIGGDVPPWKKKGAAKKAATADPFDNVEVMADEPKTSPAKSPSKAIPEPVDDEPEPESSSGFGGFKKSSQPKTFVGDRGGAAEDADLLAELRAISMGTKSADRFAGDDDEEDDPLSPPKPVARKKADVPPWKKKTAPGKKSGGDVPPWKKKGTAKKAVVNVDPFDNVGVTADQPKTSPAKSPAKIIPEPVEDEPQEEANFGGFKKNSEPKTFVGDRGGAAEDADLLAELRAISMGAKSADRFAGGDDDEGGDSSAPPKQSAPAKKADVPPWKKKKAPAKKPGKSSSGGGVPPWKKKGASTGGFKSNSEPKTFNGDRGGAAEDADLLAELRAISSKNEKSDRFANDEDEDPPSPPPPPRPRKTVAKKSTRPSKPVGSGTSPSKVQEAQRLTTIELPPAPSSRSTEPIDDIVVTEENAAEYLESKNWKLRKASYDVLNEMMISKTQSQTAANDIDGRSIHPSLDSSLPSMLKDSNASALDSALRVAFAYFDHCKGGCDPDQVSRAVVSIVKGPALSATRPSSAKLTECTIMKVMEVSKNEPSSIHIVVENLLEHGLTSRKPKVVIKSVALILEAAKAFGAATLPLAQISSSASKMLNHTNGAVRDNGIQIIVEICRAVGSKDPLSDVFETMRAAQVKEVDGYLSQQSHASEPSVGLRYGGESSASDALEVLKAGAEANAAEKLANREAVNILEELKDTEYKAKIKEAKWSEKTAALDILISCGGEQPYKLVQPSSSANYIPLLSELKKLLKHTHFAVRSKTLAAFSMIAEGVGEKLFSHLKPLLPVLLSLTKDKKVIRPTHSCLDSLFGNIIGFSHLLDKEDGLPSVLDEKKEKNIIVRQSCLSFLLRCIERNYSAGPRGSLDEDTAADVARLCVEKTNDSDAGVRKEAVTTLKGLLDHENDGIKSAALEIAKSLEQSNPRSYKSLVSSASKNGNQPSSPRKASSRPPTSNPASRASPEKKSTASAVDNKSTTSKRRSNLPSSFNSTSSARRKSSGTSQPKKKPTSAAAPRRPQTAKHKPSAPSSGVDIDVDESNMPDPDDAINYLSSLGIEKWDSEEDDDGVLLGLKSGNWKLRKGAIEALTEFSRTDKAKGEGQTYAANVIVVTKHHTKEFKESNFNVLKAALFLFHTLCDLFQDLETPMDIWMCNYALNTAVAKIADKKYSIIAGPLLSRICEVQLPEVILSLSITSVESIKSPLPHEGLLSWAVGFCKEFGAVAMGRGLNACIAWILKECESSNVKVKNAALSLIGEMHKQLGPVMKAMVLSTVTNESLKSQIEKKIESNPYDPSATIPTKKCLVNGGSDDADAGNGSALAVDIPKTDLLSALPPDILDQMGNKEKKDSWKLRKAALDEVESACEQYRGLISTSSDAMMGLLELMRALNARLSDSQSNLKPIAARNIASILNSIDANSQPKLGKIVYASLIKAGMSDNKNIVRDAALEALKKGTLLSEIDGGSVNTKSMEPLIAAFSSEVGDSEYKALGLPDIIKFMTDRAEHFPTPNTTTAKGRSTLALFAKALVGCLTSTKSGTRSSAETLLRDCMKYDVLSVSTIEKGASKLKPVEQGKVKTVVEALRSEGCVGSGASVRAPSRASNYNGSRAPSRASNYGGSRAPSRASNARSRSKTPGPRQGGRSMERSSSRMRPRSRSTARSRPGTAAGPMDIEDLLSNPGFHPLKSHNISSSTKRQRAMRQREYIPEYPEEPTGKDTMLALKKAWSSLLPPQSIEVLFPAEGILKQDDATPGCALLSHAISILKSDGEEQLFIEQLDLIIRWFALALCCRDTTSGLESLLQFLTQMLSLVRDQGYQLSDSECSMFVPYVIEKAGVAKGRFRDKMRDLIIFFSEGEIYPCSKYGSIICVGVLEKSSNSKTRVIASNEILACLDMCGLPAIGKKGIQVSARAFSEESLPENRAAYLDLIECVIEKMNGDTNKYYKLCGSSTLSRKARETIEKRLSSNTKKRQTKRPSTGNSIRKSIAPTEMHSASPLQQPQNEPESPVRDFPSLDLAPSTSGNGEQSIFRTSSEHSMNGEIDGPFKFSYQGKLDDRQSTYTQMPPSETISNERALNNGSTSTGAAASLRERLKHIRDKHKQEVDVTGVSLPIPPTPVQKRVVTQPCPLYEDIVMNVNKLLSEETPLQEMTGKFTHALIGLRQFHSSLSNNNSDSTGTNPQLLQDLRRHLQYKVPECVELLTRVLEFGFKCGTPVHPQGLSVPLLSVSIAGLMAIFLDAKLASQVSKDILSLVIHRGTACLLDRRLSASSDSSGLDASTCKKMVKAINKLAIQASYGAKRHISLQTLLFLQMRYCLSADPSTPSDDNSSIAHRMSRIITKLFTRVIKAEENEIAPFSSDEFDLEVVLRTMEPMMLKWQSHDIATSTITSAATSTGSALDSYSPDDYFGPCKDMMHTFTRHILKAKISQGKMEELRQTFKSAGLLATSHTAILFTTCAKEVGAPPLFQTLSLPEEREHSFDVDYLSELIYAVGGAEEDEERVIAMGDLRDYLEAHKEIDIEAHLSGVSTAFRKYILEQLKSPFRPLTRQSSRSLLSGFTSSTVQTGAMKTDASTRSVVSGVSAWDDGNMSMSEKLRFLKNKINATEARLSNSDMSTSAHTSDSPPSILRKSKYTDNSPPVSKSNPSTNTSMNTMANSNPSPVVTGPSSPPSSKSMSSLRQRLAAASVRANAKSPEAVMPSRPSSAMGNAAALRARLNSVKRLSSMGADP